MARTRMIRDEAAPPDDTWLVRALFDAHLDVSVFDRTVLLADVTQNFELFGYYGLSLWATSAEWTIDRVLAAKCQRAAHVALFTAGDLRDKGLGLAPSGKAPHYDATVGGVHGNTFGSAQITAPGAEDLVDRFVSAPYTVVENKHHSADAG